MTRHFFPASVANLAKVAPKKGKPSSVLSPKFTTQKKPKAQVPNSAKKIKEMPSPKISKKFNKGY